MDQAPKSTLVLPRIRCGGAMHRESEAKPVARQRQPFAPEPMPADGS